MKTEIDITSLVSSDDYNPWNLCNSVSHLGKNVAKITWENSKNLVRSTHPQPLPVESVEVFKTFVRESGGWTREEIDSWDSEELNTLFVQWVSGDIRECFGDDLSQDFNEWDWEQYEVDDQVPSRLFRSNGKLYFDLGS